MSDPRRAIPAVERLLSSQPFASLAASTPRPLLARIVREVQDDVRASKSAVGVGDAPTADLAWYAQQVTERLALLKRPSLVPLINATGVVLHTNLGRAPLADSAVRAMTEAAASYTNLEFDIDSGTRGSRYDHCSSLLTELTGAEAALVVNNNAAALVLALNTLADGRDAVVSRGELVEIGGSFRIPEIVGRSGARLIEVGATNRTHPGDYRAALTAETAAILKVHRSNFRITGFTAEVDLQELVRIAADRDVPVVNDLGSGLLMDPADIGLPPEPTPNDALRAGADIVTLSGDKLLGGPQAGIVLGRKELVGRMRRNPLCRALRVDKLTLAGLEATLALYRDPARARAEIPVLRMLADRPEEIGVRAHALLDRLRAASPDLDTHTVDGASSVGGGAYPEVELPTLLLAVRSPLHSANQLAARLRAGEPAVIARLQQESVVLDLRTVRAEEEDRLVAALVRAGGADG